MNNQEMIRLVLFGASSAAFLSLYINYKMYSQMLTDIIPLPIQTWKELLTNSDNKGFVLFKDQLKHPSKKFKSQFDIGSNMVFFNSIPLPHYRFAHYTQMMNQYRWRVKLKQCPYQVTIPIMSDSKIINTLSYSYNSIFDSKEKPGFFKTIFKYTVATFALFANIILEVFLSTNINSKPVIDGPTWGTLTMISQIVVDKPLVLLCKIEGKTLIPMFAGLNKKDIQKWLENSKQKQLWFMMITLFFLYKTRSPFIRFVRQLWRTFTAQVNKLKANRMKEQVVKNYETKVADEQCCIICYNQCRNLIIRKCRHLILCSSCVRQNAIKSCPMCRVDIDDDDLIKIIACKE